MTISASYLGPLYMIVATLCFTIVHVCVKELSHLPVLEIVFFRSILVLFFTSFNVFRERPKLSRKQWVWPVARGLAGALGLILFFYAIKLLPFAAAVTLLYLSPFFSMLFSVFLNHERPKLFQIFFILLAFSGVALMRYGSFSLSFYQFFIGIMAAVFAGLAYAIIRGMRNFASTSLTIFFFPLMTIPIVLPFLPSQWIPPTKADYPLLFLIGIFSQLALIFMTKAYQKSEVATVGPLSYLNSVYAVVIGSFYFDEKIDLVNIAAIVIIIVALTLNTILTQKKVA